MRLERTTHSLEGCCSIQLSYGTVVFSFCGGKYRSSFDFAPPGSGLWQGDRIKTAPSRAFCSSTQRGVRRKNRVSSFYGSHAMAKTFLEMLATLPQTPKSFPRHLRGSRKRQKVSRETCGTPANAKKFSEALAGLPQTPKSFSRDLRDSRKHQKVFRRTCNSVANARKFFVRLATVLQTPKSFSWDLQRCCKRQKVFRETCNGVANA